MKIIRTTSGNVIIKNAAGKTICKINPQADLEVKNDNEVLVKNAQGQYYTLFADRVTHTQIEPAAQVAFSGDAYALIDLLQASFFFKLNITDAADVTYDNTTSGLTATDVQSAIDELSVTAGVFNLQYNKVNWQNFLASTPSVTSYANAIAPNLLLAFPIYIGEDTTIERLKIKVTVGAVGNSVWGLYNCQNGLPTDLIFQITAFNNAVAAAATYVLPTPQTVQSGFYYIAYNSSSAPGLALSCASATSLHSIMGGDVSDVPAALLGRALVYSGTLPATFGAVSTYYSSISVVSIPLVQFLIS